jgi:hypothetical protein
MAVSNRFDGSFFVVVGAGGILPIVSTYLALSHLVRSMMPDFDVGLCGTVEPVANTSRLPTSTSGHDGLHCSNITEPLPYLLRFSCHRAISQCRVPARSIDGLRSRSNMNRHMAWSGHLGQTALSRSSCTAQRQKHRLGAIGAVRTRHIAESSNESLGSDKALNR